jgi:hypothetical protein
VTEHEACLRLLTCNEDVPDTLTGAERLAVAAHISLQQAEEISTQVTKVFGLVPA